MSEYFKIGRLVATFGLKGELVLKHSLGQRSRFEGLKHIFVEEGSANFIPYFLEKAQVKNEQETYLKLEGLDTKEAARRLTPRDVWLSENDFEKHTAANAPISLLGYHLIDGKTDLGEIIEVIEQPHQVLCSIRLGDNTALIPIHGASLQRVDRKARKVYVELPEGLLDIYR